MIDSKTLVNLRTRKELINYFKNKGINITEEEIETLKQNYQKTDKNNCILNIKQLDKVAGGTYAILRTTEHGKSLQVLPNSNILSIGKGVQTHILKASPSNIIIDRTIKNADGEKLLSSNEHLSIFVDDERGKSLYIIPLNSTILAKETGIVERFQLENIFNQLLHTDLFGTNTIQFNAFRSALKGAGYDIAERLRVVRQAK